ncbi:TonB-dependent receptor [Sphingomonas sp.]|uniref:TonB-dependent receptor n=1 Tax=Sphingomonas sp. TaxID=28214 RepID=UPI001D44C1C6|nr:TonB-dependent receptor [Sphingomonas sp.]MBX9796430.1 TonB-dependent receptor [Sphingomonas sp.]
MKKIELLAAASAFALLYTAPAMAKTGEPGAPAAQDQEPETQADIVVTATKREQTLLDTPISVSVTTGATIQQAQIRDAIDLQTVVPSLRVGQLQSSANTNFIIRGFGNGANNAGIEPSVGVYIDGVYRSRSAAQISDLPNLKRVEVLRGPQSTLFGKNASAGVISITTAEPSFEWTGFGELTYGNFNSVIARAQVSGPISDTFAFDVSANFNRRDGYFRDLNTGINQNDRNRWGGRFQLLWQPNADLKMRLIADYDKIDEVCCGVVNLLDGPTGNAVRAVGGRIVSNQPFADQAFYNFASTNDIQNYGVSLNTDATIGKFALTNITAYREVISRTNQDSDFTSADLIGANNNFTRINTFTNEFRIQSNFEGKFNFTLGSFYFNETIRVADGLTYGRDFRGYANLLTASPTAPTGSINATLEQGILGLPAGTIGRQGLGQFNDFGYRNSAFSFFGYADWEVARGLTLTVGFNYTNDWKGVNSNSFTTDTFSTLDLVAIGNGLVRNQGIAQGVGQALGLPAGTLASAQQIGTFAAAQPAIFNQINAGATAFANANSLNPAVNPLLGLRGLQFLPPSLNFPNVVEPGTTNDSNLSYTFRANYRVDENVNIYVTYATGFKASSWNLSRDSRPFPADFIPGSPVTNPPTSRIRAAGLAVPNLTTGTRFAGPEIAETVEGGIKARWGKVAFNFAAFYQELRGFQQNAFFGTGFSLVNAGKQSTMGFEIDSSYRPWRPLELTFALTYLSPLYDRFVGGIGPGGVPTDLSGRVPAGISQIYMSLGANYTKTFSNGNRLIISSDFQYDSNVQISDQFNNFFREIQNLNAAISYRLKNGIELSIFSRNLLDQRFTTTVFPSVAQAGSVSGYANPPRTFGITGRYRF